jgi:hypothetical protein
MVHYDIPNMEEKAELLELREVVIARQRHDKHIRGNCAVDTFP